MQYTEPVTEQTKSDITESALELRVIFHTHWIDKWVAPNPFISILLPALKDVGVSLDDFSFKPDPRNIADNGLVVNISQLQCVITVGLDRITFRLANPDWDMAEKLAAVFQNTLNACQGYVALPIQSQDYVLGFHVTPGSMDFKEKSAALFNTARIGEADFYGVSITRETSTLVIEKSLKYEGGAFFRLTRKFEGAISFEEIAVSIYSDEVGALQLLDIQGLV